MRDLQSIVEANQPGAVLKPQTVYLSKHSLVARIARLKRDALEAAELGHSRKLEIIIAELDRIWTDDRAAQAFYTRLEKIEESRAYGEEVINA